MIMITDKEMWLILFSMVLFLIGGVLIGLCGGKGMVEKSLASQGYAHYEANPISGDVSFMIGTNVVNVYK